MMFSLAGSGRVRRRLALTLVIVGLASFAACRGGSSGGVINELTLTPAPQPEPTIAGSRYYFPARGYEALIPDGWHSDANTVVAGPLKVDTFFSPGEVDGVQANVSVSCEENPSGASTEQYVENRLETLHQLAATDVKELGSISVSGVEGQMVSYTLVRGQTTIRKTDVMVVASRCAWLLALATAPSEENQVRDVFDRFLASFRLIDDSPPKGGS